MKRFSKVLISMLLLVSMLAGYIPALDFTTTANAAETTVRDWQQLKSAVEGAANGDIIVVSKDIPCGTLGTGNVVTLCQMTVTKNITIKSAAGSVFTLTRPQWYFHLSADKPELGQYNTCRRPLFIISSGGTLNLENITVKGGSGQIADDGTGRYSDSGIYVKSGGTLNLNSGATVTGFSMQSSPQSVVDATHGGNITVFPGGTMNLNDGSVISNGYSYSHGGGFTNQGTVNIDTCSWIKNNKAASQGGGFLNWDAGKVTMRSGVIRDNTAGSHGGGVSNLGTFTMTGGMVMNNTSGNCGGGIQTQFGTIKITGGCVTGNTAVKGGGVAWNAGVERLSYAYIYSNTATTEGYDLWYNTAQSNNNNVTVSVPMFNSEYESTLMWYLDKSGARRTNTSAINTVTRNGTSYPNTGTGFVMIKITPSGDSVTLESGNSLSFNVKSNDGPWVQLRGISNTMGSYSSENTFGNGSGMLVNGYKNYFNNATSATGTYGTAAFNTNGTVTYTLTNTSLHTEDWTENFWYDAYCPISNNETNFGGCAKITITIKANCSCLHSNATSSVTKAATCSETGVRTYTCPDCGATWTESIAKDSNNHSDIRDVAEVAATCTTAGTTSGRKCFGCNTVISGIEAIPALGHDFTSGVYKYNNNNTHSQKCSRCDAYNDAVACTPGSTYYSNGNGQSQTHYLKCTVCNGAQTAVAHTWNSGTVTTQPTCTDTGIKTYTCTASGCGATYTEVLPALGHSFTSTDYRCNNDGTHSVKCIRCDEYGATVACSLGSYTSNGGGENDTHSATCSVCNGTFSAVHTWEETARTGDCGTDGYVDYRCSVCGQTRREIVTASGEHTAPDEWTIVTEVTCVTDGLREKRCTVCGSVLESEVISATGHNYVATVTDPTCTAQGYTTHVCSNCNDTYVDNYVDALGHDWGDWTVVTYPTISAPGEEKRVCRRCGAVEQREIPQLTQTTLAASNETTTPGGTATVTFKLTGNPGIWSQNFVIYFPKALTVESVTASTAVYSNYDMGGTSTGIIPTSNERMLEYFNAAGIADSSKYKAIAYYTDNGSEDSHENGLIVSVTFRVPESGKCLKHYDVNLFGVFADNGGDAVNWNGDSIVPAIVYKNGGIDIPEGIDACETHSFGDWTVTAEPTCTSKGMKERECSVCGLIEQEEIEMLAHTWVDATCTEAGYCSVCGTVNPDAPALGHLWGDWITVREASGISPEIQKRHCGRCSAFETREYGSAIGTGYSEYAGDELTYKYYLTDTVTPGHEYVIVNSNTAGAAKSLTDINTAISSQNITVENDGTGLFVSPSADSYIWNTTGKEGSVMFANKSSGKFLKAYGETDTPDISLNVTSSDNPFGSSAFMYNSNGYSAKSGYYLGYKSDITVQESTGGTGAAPSGDILEISSYTHIKDRSGTKFYLNSPFTLEFDFAFYADNSIVSILSAPNLTQKNMINISSETKNICLFYGENQITLNASSYLLRGTDYKIWNHFKFEVADGYATVTLNGHQFDRVSCGSYNFAPTEGFLLHVFDENIVNTGGNSAYDNFSITVGGDLIGTITSGDFDSCAFGYDTLGSANKSLPNDWSNGSSTTIKTYATNVFTASNNSSDKVYFYEKRPVGDAIEVYELVDTITVGETYVLVDANEEGSAKLLAADATASSTTVYSDGISYTPYVTATAEQEFTVVKAGNGYIFNNINDSFLSATGMTGSLTADNVLECENGAVTVNGTKYYLYKKTQITAIDTALASDFAVVDFGTGITVGADDVRAFRNNDTYSDRVGVSLSGLVVDDTGLTKNNKFYKYNLDSGKLAAANGEGVYVLDKSGVGTLSLTLGEGAALRFVPTSANYETVQTFTYQCTVDRIGAYMYADLKVIPATTIYYEDNREGFITYTNGTYPDAETGAKWEIVDSNSAINTLFGDEKVYGYSDDYTSYLKYSGNSAHKITVTSSQITSGTGWMPTAEFTFSGTGFDLISATSGATTLVTLEITNTVTGETKKIAVNSYFGYQYIPADNETGTPASWEPVAKDDTVAMYQVPIVRWRGNYGNYSVKIIPTYNKIMDVAKLGYSDFYLDAVRVYNPVDVSDAANADVKSQYQADKELVAYEANLRRMLIPKDSVIPGESSSVSGVVFTDGNGLTRTVNTYTDYTNPIANNEIIVPAGTGVSFALNAADGKPDRILLGAKVSAGVGTDESVELVVSGGGEPKTIRLGTSTDMYYDITDAIKWNGTTTETITIYNRGIEGKDPHISLTNIKFTSGSETASLSSLNFFVSAAMEADTYKVLAEEFGVELVYGDIDGDGTVNTVDSKLIKKQMLGLIELAGYDYEAGDIDGDGEISSKDVKLLMKMLLTD